ncbi:MAG: hypothetical protein V8R21_07440 [Dysosmobacter sp.]
MEPIREAEMQTQPGKRLNEESKKNGKVWKIVVGVVVQPPLWCSSEPAVFWLMPALPFSPIRPSMA